MLSTLHGAGPAAIPPSEVKQGRPDYGAGEGERNLLLTLRFRGDCFHGSAVQPNAQTVQGTLQPVLERILGEPLALKCCSRTDAGVHARMFCVSMRTHARIPAGRLPYALNALLPAGISAYACREVPAEFHARYSAKGKRYAYYFLNTPHRDPFWEGRGYWISRPLDEMLLESNARDFLGTHDFSAFCAAHSSVKDYVRTIRHASVKRKGEIVIFEVAGDGFLYNMVRIMGGTLLDIALGRMESGSIPQILASRDRGKAGVTLPPEGLYLEEVYY